ncbi:MAG: histidine kinase [Prolixibacteraceae bacterium]|nr:histidine kinase [Prolixibacteraceae bacterium]
MAENQLPIFFRHRFLWHILFWIVIFLTYWLMYAGYMEYYYVEFMWGLTLLPARIIAAYTFIYLILPFAIDKKRFITFGILTLIHSFLYGFFIWATYHYANLFPEMVDLSKMPLFDVPHILNKLASNYGIPAIAAALVIFKKWYSDEQNNKKLVEEKMAAELNFLKSQVHPHFLFNTLNNLYALTLIKSDKTPDIVLKLSDLLDYMIYKSNDEFVPLTKELEIIQGYIELERMRYNERLDLQYEIKGNAEGYEIAPLILLPFIENCFKHGASNDRSRPGIRILLEIEPAYLKLSAVNTIPQEKKNDESQSEGIGLNNVKRRLELIYPNRHKLNIIQEEKTFSVELKIFSEK